MVSVNTNEVSAVMGATAGSKAKQHNRIWNRSLNFDSVALAVSSLGSSWFVYNQKIFPAYPLLKLHQFTIKDSAGQPLVVSGAVNVLSGDLNKLNFKASGFSLMNTQAAFNNKISGQIVMDAALSITGNVNKVVMKGDISLNNETAITFLMPVKKANAAEAKSLMQFIDKDTFLLYQNKAQQPDTDNNPPINSPSNYQLGIRADKGVAFTILLDPNTGDLLKLTGAAKLKAGIDSTGNWLLSGTYQPDSGYYEVNYQFSQKRFYLQPGSSIVFNGRPAGANLNIRAVCTVKTAPQNLLASEMGAVNASFAALLKQEMPFSVVLFLKGTLTKPEISFDIRYEGAGTNSLLQTVINNKLAALRKDVSATNKQVFALLALDRFVGEQTADFFKGNGAGLNDVANESVSKFLASVLDHIASDLFKGINTRLKPASYKDFANSEALQKELNVEGSKNFINDRLTVTTGKNFGIESRDGSAKAAQQKGSRFLPDVTVNYKLSADGNYMLRSYTKNQFEVIMDGYVIETGVAFLVTMDYERFKELFIKKNAGK